MLSVQVAKFSLKIFITVYYLLFPLLFLLNKAIEMAVVAR